MAGKYGWPCSFSPLVSARNTERSSSLPGARRGGCRAAWRPVLAEPLLPRGKCCFQSRQALESKPRGAPVRDQARAVVYTSYRIAQLSCGIADENESD